MSAVARSVASTSTLDVPPYVALLLLDRLQLLHFIWPTRLEGGDAMTPKAGDSQKQ
jgi:hypothetical protein